MKKLACVICIPAAIYRRHVIVFFGASIDEIIAYGVKHRIGRASFSLEWVEIAQQAAGKNAGFCLDYGEGNGDILVWVRKYPKTAAEVGILYHELYHAVECVASAVDPIRRLVDEDGHSEARANLFEYLVTEVNRVLWK